jgi:class 3 adenylate cyclase/tetratricopeptide (TPR) repeat protein
LLINGKPNGKENNLPTRKLAAIAFVDIVGYTAMMDKDEAATLHLLSELRKILYPLVEKFNGSVLKEVGDGILLSFDSAFEAVNCASVLQRNSKNVPRLRLRVGIHLGDVVIEENEVFGEGVDIAAQIQHVAVPGGIVVTEDMWKQLKNHQDFSFVSPGGIHLKGIHSAVKLFAVSAEGISIPTLTHRFASYLTMKRTLAALLLIGVTGIAYLLSPLYNDIDSEGIPSLAILYIKNLGSEAEEPYSYGITQDLIVDVAKAGIIRVVPMKDILSLSKTELPIDKIAKQLNVRYVMEGSLKREGDFFRLTGQIIEAASGRTLWADHVRTSIDEAASMKGQLAKVVIGTLQIKAMEKLRKEIIKSRTANPEAYEFYLRAKYLYDKKQTKDDLFTSRGMFERAIVLDSTFVPPRIGLGKTYETEGEYNRSLQIYEQAISIAHTNGEISDEAECRRRKGIVLWIQGEHNEALDVFTTTLNMFQDLGVRDGEAKTLNNIGIMFMDQGNYSKALEYYSQSLNLQKELGDRDGQGRILNNIALTYEQQGDYTKALNHYHESLTIAKELEDRQSEALTLLNIGVIFAEQSKHQQALENYNKSLTIRHELGDRYGEGETMSYIGKLYYEMNDYQNARDNLQKAIPIFEQANIKHSLVSSLSLLALVEAQMGYRENAKNIVQRIETTFQPELQETQSSEINWNLFQTHKLIGNREKALLFLDYAYREITESAKSISDTTVRKIYLQNIKQNSEIIAEWEKSQNTQVSIAR